MGSQPEAPAAPLPKPGKRTRRQRFVRRALVAVPAALVVLVLVAYATTAIFNVPPPHTLFRVETAKPSRWGDLFPARPVQAPAQAIPLDTAARDLPQTIPWKGGQIDLAQFLDTTRTNAFIVLHDGKITYEWYHDGITAGTKLSSWSAAKSVVSLLVGQAIERHELSEDDHLVQLLPELRTGGDYDKITVRDLLDMASGVDVSENYDQWRPFVGTAGMYLTHDLAGFVKDHRGVLYTPGSRASYRSVDTQLLGLILSKVTHRPLADLLAERIWQPIGAENTASWNLDRPGGTEKAFCCINATARDYARIGQLVLDNGRVGQRQVVPAAWITRIATPAAHVVDDWPYSAQWWHPPGATTTDYSAVGVYGQYIYVSPATRTVIVKLSDYGTEQDEQETINALRALSRS